jgi:hypothetical protein
MIEGIASQQQLPGLLHLPDQPVDSGFPRGSRISKRVHEPCNCVFEALLCRGWIAMPQKFRETGYRFPGVVQRRLKLGGQRESRPKQLACAIQLWLQSCRAAIQTLLRLAKRGSGFFSSSFQRVILVDSRTINLIDEFPNGFIDCAAVLEVRCAIDFRLKLVHLFQSLLTGFPKFNALFDDAACKESKQQSEQYPEQQHTF